MRLDRYYAIAILGTIAIFWALPSFGMAGGSAFSAVLVLTGLMIEIADNKDMSYAKRFFAVLGVLLWVYALLPIVAAISIRHLVRKDTRLGGACA